MSLFLRDCSYRSTLPYAVIVVCDIIHRDNFSCNFTTQSATSKTLVQSEDPDLQMVYVTMCCLARAREVKKQVWTIVE
jgi:hypothetical protein